MNHCSDAREKQFSIEFICHRLTVIYIFLSCKAFHKAFPQIIICIYKFELQTVRTFINFLVGNGFILLHCKIQICFHININFKYRDCNDKSMKSGIVDIKLQIETAENVPANTSAYCLLSYDKVFELYPMTNKINV